MNPMMGGCNPMMMGGMNPMMAMMSQMNPMMAMMGQMNQMKPGMGGMGGMPMNPMAMMGAMLGGMGNMGGMPAMSAEGASSTMAASTPQADQAPVDPRVKALCKEYSIDANTCRTLHDVMKTREDYDEDIQALSQLVQRSVNKGKKPLDVMLSQIRSIKAGRFAGKDV